MPPLPLRAALAGALVVLAACSDRPDATTAPPAPDLRRHHGRPPVDEATVRAVRLLAYQQGVVPLRRPARVRRPLVRLGQALAFDPILSGNRNIACTTCHLPAFATGDARSLSIGEGGAGFGPERTHPAGVLIPRNAPPLFNLGERRRLFWDGRVEEDAAGIVHTPAGEQVTPEMQRVFEFGAVSALAMFPVTSRTEMRGTSGNELAAIPDDDATAIWAGLMRRLGAIPEYRAMFRAAYPHTRFEDMTFAHASNAIGGFLVDRLSFGDSPWDRFLAGDDRALTPAQLEGARTFLSLRCVTCHTGATFSDDEFHNVAVAQLGPGQGNGPSGRDDFGRMNVTGNPADRYRFRTSPLRNVELTAPYGHDGAVTSLRAFIAHYSESDLKLRGFDAHDLDPVLGGTLLPNAEEILATRDPLLDGVVLGDEIVDALVAYMQALTDDHARDLRRLVPHRVPSGLPVDRP
ncbi:MAG TPA: cytochrome c peroxidase [Gemmatimonadaceae bacterium]|nr:cytochrome c peroxidase [Gemmatimonadaceae bacterium]